MIRDVRRIRPQDSAGDIDGLVGKVIENQARRLAFIRFTQEVEMEIFAVGAHRAGCQGKQLSSGRWPKMACDGLLVHRRATGVFVWSDTRVGTLQGVEGPHKHET
jgi:hypothetical protein